MQSLRIKDKEYSDSWWSNYEYESNDPTHYLIPFTSHGDYIGSTVERSNHETIKKHLTDNGIPVIDICGHYQSYCLIIPATYKDNDLISDLISDLENYPLFDNEHWSELELNLAEEYLVTDFKNEYGLEDYSDHDIIEAYHIAIALSDKYSIEFEIGCIPYLHQTTVNKIIELLETNVEQKTKIKR